MGYDAERARGLLRLSLGRFNTQAEIDRFLKILSDALSTPTQIPAPDRPPEAMGAEALAVS